MAETATSRPDRHGLGSRRWAVRRSASGVAGQRIWIHSEGAGANPKPAQASARRIVSVVKTAQILVVDDDADIRGLARPG
jgi:hypothetical protein